MRGLRRQLAHELARLVITDFQVRHLEAAPTSLALSKRQVVRRSNNLTHACMADEMRVDRRRFTHGLSSLSPSQSMSFASQRPFKD
jgi:hypothetical protein